MPKSHTELTENSAQGTNIATNQTELTESSAQPSNVPNNLTELKEKVRKALT